MSCTFEADSDFSNSVHNGTSFSNSSFNKNTNMEHSSFVGEPDFYRTRFYDSVDFSRSNLRDANFLYSVFNGNTKFLFANLYNVEFNNVLFSGDVSFINATFYKNIKFLQSKFQEEPIFYGSEFYGSAKFIQSQFEKGVSFKNAFFNANTSFDESTFAKDAKFNGAKFRKAVGFNNSQFDGDAFFDGAELEGKLFLKGAKYDKFLIRWNDINDLDYDDSAYLLIIENFKKLGFFADADKSYYSYRVKYRQNLPALYKPVDWMMMTLYGYGTIPELPLAWSGLIIVACGFLFFVANGVKKDSNKSADVQESGKSSSNSSQIDQGLSIWEALNFSATAFTSGASAFVSYPNDFKPVGKSRYLVTLERILGWVFFTLFLAALARTIIR